MRRAFVLVMTCAALCGAATAAIGGGSPIVIQDGDDLRESGEMVTLSGDFWAGSQAPVSAGPWFATLKEYDGEAGRTPLGPVTVTAVDGHWFATVTFTVPDLPVGEYWVEVSNEHGEGVGDLMGGSLRIAPSAAAWRVHVLQLRHERSLERTKDQRAEAREALEQATSVNTNLRDERDALTARLEEVEATLRAVRANASRAAAPLVPRWAAGLFAISILAAAFTVVARRHRAMSPPAAPASSAERETSESDRAA